MDGWIDGWMDAWMDGWMHGCMDGWRADGGRMEGAKNASGSEMV